MKLCPNCEMPFEEKAGLLHCAEHGWHGLNEAGEVIPAEEPSGEQIAAWQAAQAAKADAEKSTPPIDDPGGTETFPQGDSAPASLGAGEKMPRVIINDSVIYTAAIVIGLAVVGLAVYDIYRKSKRAAQ